MTIKKQTILLTVVFDEDETYAESAAEAISHRLFNEEGIIQWEFTIKEEETWEEDE